VNQIRRTLFAFRCAAKGLADVVRTQANARFHCLAAVGVVAAGFGFRIAAWEWCAVTLAIALVFAAEAINTAIERLLDRLHPDQDPSIGAAKDLSAGAVLAAAIGAAVIALIVFGPRLLRLL
jgi:diacylglycerol kinase (ATP)